MADHLTSVTVAEGPLSGRNRRSNVRLRARSNDRRWPRPAAQFPTYAGDVSDRTATRAAHAELRRQVCGARRVAKKCGRSRLENDRRLLRGQHYMPMLVPPLVFVPVPEPVFVPELDVVFRSILP